jgi:hypothetical protein
VFVDWSKNLILNGPCPEFAQLNSAIGFSAEAMPAHAARTKKTNNTILDPDIIFLPFETMKYYPIRSG